MLNSKFCLQTVLIFDFCILVESTVEKQNVNIKQKNHMKEVLHMLAGNATNKFDFCHC